MQFILNLAGSIVSTVGAFLGVSVADRMRRRRVLVVGTFLSACFLGMNGALSARWAQLPDDAKNLAVGKAAVASFFFCSFVYNFTYLPLQALYPVECLTTNGRAKGESSVASSLTQLMPIQCVVRNGHERRDSESDAVHQLVCRPSGFAEYWL